MCIRDSACTLWHQIPVHRDSCELQGKHIVEPACYDDLGVCLLYTSDAADERSSVDLGGRRIIKKKKQETNGVLAVVNKPNK